MKIKFDSLHTKTFIIRIFLHLLSRNYSLKFLHKGSNLLSNAALKH